MARDLTLDSSPRLSVIMPILNGAATVALQLEGLARQTTRDWELVVSDNGCTDDSVAIIERWRHALPTLTIADASATRGLSYARNVGAAAARSSQLAFCDADDVVSPDWVATMTSALEQHDIVGGRLDEETLNSERSCAERSARQRTGLPTTLGFLPYATGANFGVRSCVVEQLDGWNEGYVRGADDVDFCWRAQLAGFQIGFEPDAVISYRHRIGLSALRRQHFGYGSMDPLLYCNFRDSGLRRSAVRTPLLDWLWLLRHAGDAFASDERQGIWNRKLAHRWGRTIGSATNRVWFP